MIVFRMERMVPPGMARNADDVAVQKAEPVPTPTTDVQHAYDVYDEGADGAVTRVR